MSYQDFTPEQKQAADMKLAELEPVMIRAQFNLSLDRLRELFEARLSENPEAGRYLIEKIHLIAGERRSSPRFRPVYASSIDQENKGA